MTYCTWGAVQCTCTFIGIFLVYTFIELIFLQIILSIYLLIDWLIFLSIKQMMETFLVKVYIFFAVNSFPFLFPFCQFLSIKSFLKWGVNWKILASCNVGGRERGGISPPPHFSCIFVYVMYIDSSFNLPICHNYWQFEIQYTDLRWFANIETLVYYNYLIYMDKRREGEKERNREREKERMGEWELGWMGNRGEGEKERRREGEKERRREGE